MEKQKPGIAKGMPSHSITYFSLRLSLEYEKFVAEKVPDEDDNGGGCFRDDGPGRLFDAEAISHFIECVGDNGVQYESGDGNGDKLKKNCFRTMVSSRLFSSNDQNLFQI
jgi:hypothetical protein